MALEGMEALAMEDMALEAMEVTALEVMEAMGLKVMEPGDSTLSVACGCIVASHNPCNFPQLFRSTEVKVPIRYYSSSRRDNCAELRSIRKPDLSKLSFQCQRWDLRHRTASVSSSQPNPSRGTNIAP